MRKSNEINASICLYGVQSTGAGYLAERRDQPGQFFGDGETKPGRSFTEAVHQALADLGLVEGKVRIFAPGGDLVAELRPSEFRTFGGLKWRSAADFAVVLSAEEIERAGN